MRIFPIAAAIFASTTAILVIAGVARVSWLEGQEMRSTERATIGQLSRREDATPQSVRLARARLHRDQYAVFELCAADDPMQPARWADAMAVAVWRPRARELMTRSELTEETLRSEHVRRNETQGCLTIGRGVIAEDDDYAVEAFWEQRPEALADVTLVTTILARRPLEDVDLFLVMGAWLSALGLALSFAFRAPAGLTENATKEGRSSIEDLDLWEREQAEARKPMGPELRLVIGVALLVCAYLLSSFVPSGAAASLLTSVALSAIAIGIAVGFASGPGMRRRASMLALARPERAWLFFPLAVVVGLLLFGLAVLVSRLVPSTGESPVQVFVSWPSGMLSFAVLGVIAPIGEEVFFRGFVYGALEKRSAILAFALAWILFALPHSIQVWGQWGALVAITVTGFALTGLRAFSRSTVVSALAHLVYNGALAITSFL
jgi:uncharacterized protein